MLSESDLEIWMKEAWHADWFWQLVMVFFILLTLWNVGSGFSTELLEEKTTFAPVPTIQNQKQTMLALNAPFFGVYVPNAADNALALSQLDFVIVGILFSEDTTLSQVVLKTGAGFDKIYRIGESVRAGIEIRAIHPNGIVLSNHGILERLLMPEKKIHFEPPSAPLKMKD